MASKLLVVDDATFMRLMLRNILIKDGLDVVEQAQNCVEAVDKYKELKPNLVTLDITMPEKDGIAALREIKQYDNNAKVLMCSAMGQQALIIESIQNGAKDFIVKPFDEQRVLNSIHKIIG